MDGKSGLLVTLLDLQRCSVLVKDGKMYVIFLKLFFVHVQRSVLEQQHITRFANFGIHCDDYYTIIQT